MTSGGALARKSAVSRSLLSRIERGLVCPSVETLSRIANSLDVPLSRLFNDQGDHRDFCHVAAGKGIHVERMESMAGYHHELLGHQLPGNLSVEPYLVMLGPEAQPHTKFQRSGLEFLYLISGRMRYRYDAKVVELAKGDSLLFNASAPHGIEAIEAWPVIYLLVALSLRD